MTESSTQENANKPVDDRPRKPGDKRAFTAFADIDVGNNIMAAVRAKVRAGLVVIPPKVPLPPSAPTPAPSGMAPLPQGDVTDLPEPPSQPPEPPRAPQVAVKQRQDRHWEDSPRKKQRKYYQR